MKILFIDDCYRNDKKYLGHGGFCIDATNVRTLVNDVSMLKKKYKMPYNIELKWSPDPGHYLRTNFEGDRQKLYKDAILLLHKYEASIICAVHDLKECYGIQLYGWDMKRSISWAAKQQFKFLAERFERPYLEKNNDVGIVIADHYSDKKGESAIIEEINLATIFGTEFQKFEKMCMIPIMTLSEYCPPVQLADLVVGIVVCSLANSRYALDIFDDIALLFLKDPHENALSFASIYSNSVLGFGLKLFPLSFKPKGISLFQQIDKKYICTNEGIKKRIDKDIIIIP